MSSPDSASVPNASNADRCESWQWCHALTKFYRSYILRWVADDMGTWRDTLPQQAVSYWRHRFYTEKVCRHADERTQQLESQSLHGGRASAFYFGDVGYRLSLDKDAETPPTRSIYPTLYEGIHRLDVRSMYCTLLRDMHFPVRLLSVLDDVSPEEIRGMCRHWGCIAMVQLKTSTDEFPLRYNDRTLYPIGEFTTTLAGPELEYADSLGAIRKVIRLARYELGRPFKEFAKHLLAMRDRARATGDTIAGDMAKRMANSFGGKFAQRGDRWEARPNKVVPERWGRYLSSDYVTGVITQYRIVAGLPHQKVPGNAGSGLLAAVYAYLTSYGRMQMRSIRHLMGRGVVLSQDTDGIWTTDTGLHLAKSRGLLGEDTPGTMRLVSSHIFARFVDAQHYYVDGRWTLAGCSEGFKVTRDRRVVHTVITNPVRDFCKAAPGEIIVSRVSDPIPGISSWQRIDTNGWAAPPVAAFERGARKRQED